MRSFLSLSKAMTLGFIRDKTAIFFVLIFPLMFLVLFGGLLRDQGTPRSEVIQVGPVAMLDQIPADQRGGLDEVLEVRREDDLAAALRQVREGEVDAAVQQDGSRVVLHFSAADQVSAGTVVGVFNSLVQTANLAAADVTTPAYQLQPSQVEDESLQTIQFITPGLLGWAIATGATFGSALTLVSWRQKKILRRLRLSPASTASVVTARVGVSVATALVQMVIFIGVAMLPYFGLKLTGSWWMSIPLIIAGTLSFLGIGMLAGSWAKTPEGASGIANLIVLPMAFLSGSFFPLDAAPAWLQTLSNVFPLKHLNEAMQAVMVRGEGPASALPAIGILLAFAAACSVIAMWLFRWDDV